jgi:hypothetical protein
MSANDEHMVPHQDPKNKGKVGLRFNQGKLPMYLIPVSWIKGLAEVMRFGSKKYADRNWELGMNWSICYSCAMRHMLAWWGGEQCDQESGIHHLLHAAWNCLAGYFYEAVGRYSSFDDRPDHRRCNPVPPIAACCPRCNGTCVDTVSQTQNPCPRCGGKGYIE